MKLIGEGRALHVCDICGGVDDHSRHSFVGMQMPGASTDVYPQPTVDTARTVMNACNDMGLDEEDADRLLADLMDRTITDRHRDCCREAGCPSGECDRIGALGGNELRGAELVQFIMDNAELIREESMKTEV